MDRKIGLDAAEPPRRPLAVCLLLGTLGAIALAFGLALVYSGLIGGWPFGLALSALGVWAMVAGIGS